MLPRRLVRRLLGLTGTLMLVVVVMYLGPTSLLLPLLQEDFTTPSSHAPPPPPRMPPTPAALQQLYAKEANNTPPGGPVTLTPPKVTIAQKLGSQTAQKSNLQKILNQAEKKQNFEVSLHGDTDSYLQDYVPETWVEVEKVNPRRKNGGKGHNKHRRRPPTPDPNPKYSPKVLRERALTFSNTSELMAFVREQERRVRHVAATCDSLTTTTNSHQQQERTEVNVDAFRRPPTDLLIARDFIYDRKNHLMFCPVYKAASTSWSVTLLEMGGYWKKEMYKDLQNYLKKIYPKLNGLSAGTVSTDSTQFMIVRHPFERLVSCYRDKYQNGRKAYYYMRYGENMVTRYRQFPPGLADKELHLLREQVREKVKHGLAVVMPNNPYANPVGPTFREFVDFVSSTIRDDEHWRPYNIHCASCHMNYDFILRFESLNEESRMFLEYLNRSEDVKLRWDNSYNGELTVEITCEYFNQIDIKRVNDLYTKYYKDFKLYEYSPEKYRKCAKDYHLLQSKTNETIALPHKLTNKR